MYAGLEELHQALSNCQRCTLAATRTHVICGAGCEEAHLFLLGEAPGGDEDRSGIPFTGQAGKELDEFLKILGISRENIYISNTVKCRPTKPSARARYGVYANRKPHSVEIKACSDWLEEEIKIIKPKVIVTLGGVPLSRIIGKQVKVGDFRGRKFFSQRYGCYVFPLYHPAAVIYDRSKRDVYLSDLKELRRELEEEFA
ncbi:MAG: uracil-DNA glycosylase [Bacillota bacterium]|nr:uracil-DNA glycosylase [Clostridia bacterium]